MYYLRCHTVTDDLLLTRQVKQYKFLSNGETQVDGVDDANMFGVTEVRQEMLTTKHSC